MKILKKIKKEIGEEMNEIYNGSLSESKGRLTKEKQEKS